MKILIIIVFSIIISFIFPLFVSGTITINLNNQFSLLWNYNSFKDILSNIYTIVIQFWLVIVTIFLVFATLLPKIDDERQLHYNNINSDVFRRLRNLSLIRTEDRFKFGSSVNLPIDSIYYKPAINHLKKDNPEFDLELTLKKLDKLLKQNNEKAKKLDTEINDLLEIEFRKDKTIKSDKFDINESEIRRIILDCWDIHYKSLYLNPKNPIYNFHHYFPKSQFFDDNGKIYFRVDSNSSTRRILVHNITDFTPSSLEQKIDTILKNIEIIKLLQEIDEMQKNLESIIKQVKDSVKNIPSLIEKKEYRTSAKCCPGMSALMFRYLK